jgi:predicted dehydrogenase
METKKVRIGVMGCANIAERSVIPAILDLKEKFTLIAIASRNADKANAFASKFGCIAVVGYQELLEMRQIDAVYMPLPTGLHKEWILKALLAGKHVYAEKSIAMNLSDAAEMVEFAEKMNLALMEGYMFQYHKQHQVVFDLIRSGELGELRSMYSAFGFPPLQAGNFRYDPVIGGGALMDAAGYTVRAVHFLFGNRFRITASSLGFDKNTGAISFGNAFMSGSDGTGAHLAFGFDQFYQNRYEIWGSKGKITVERAFTPRPDFNPNIVFEDQSGKQEIQGGFDNHFIQAFKEYYSIIEDSTFRGKHYAEILQQSASLDRISSLAT